MAMRYSPTENIFHEHVGAAEDLMIGSKPVVLIVNSYKKLSFITVL
ncbi:hypothetical protein KFS79_19560 [Pseudomonas sp. MBT-17]|jgi:hypothetical protein|nr:hypothetical protein [Pseudomonas rustica]